MPLSNGTGKTYKRHIHLSRQLTIPALVSEEPVPPSSIVHKHHYDQGEPRRHQEMVLSSSEKTLGQDLDNCELGPLGLIHQHLPMNFLKCVLKATLCNFLPLFEVSFLLHNYFGATSKLIWKA